MIILAVKEQYLRQNGIPVREIKVDFPGKIY
jgi:hypothetical protein